MSRTSMPALLCVVAVDLNMTAMISPRERALAARYLDRVAKREAWFAAAAARVERDQLAKRVLAVSRIAQASK